MKLYLARHGRTNYNDLGLCNADPSVDVHLTPLGVSQAEVLADKFKQTQLDCIFVSELRRTQYTAEIVNTFHDVEIFIDARLNDIRTGYEGKSFSEFMSKLDANADRWTARFGDGESIEDLKQRVISFLDELRTKEYSSVLVVTSAWPINALLTVLRHLGNDEAWHIDIKQGSYLEFDL
jgi:broad specificity phosphatase PhoE